MSFKHFKTIAPFKGKTESLPVFLNIVKVADERCPQTLSHSSY